MSMKRQMKLCKTPLTNLYCQSFVAPMSSHAATSDFFRYTSGRWLYDETIQLRRRYLEFNVQALKDCAHRELGTRCVGISKLPEGLYNKVFSLKMADGREVLARIPNPNAGYPDSVVASEVATLDFLRNVLNIPVPKVLAWSSQASQAKSVGAQYILMERVKGRQLSEIWPAMSERQRFDLVKGLVDIEKRLLSMKFLAHGSIYYKSFCPNGINAISLDDLPSPQKEAGSRFVIGPTTERAFFIKSCHGQRIDQGPWRTAYEYLSAVARREMFLVQNPEAEKPSDSTRLFSHTRAGSENHVLLLENLIAILPYILPAPDITRPSLMHHDLHPDNIFVDSTDPTKISSIIDWQAAYVSPLFLQARFPSVFDCDDPYPWGAVQLSLPEEFDTLSPADQTATRERLARLRLKKFYEMASRKFNPTLFTAIDATRNHNDPVSFIFHIVGQSASDGPVPIEELLIQIYEQWNQRQGLNVQCPFSFTEEEIKEKRQRAQEWAHVYGEFEGLRAGIVGKDGWVSHGEYEEAMRVFQMHQSNLETLRERLEKLS